MDTSLVTDYAQLNTMVWILPVLENYVRPPHNLNRPQKDLTIMCYSTRQTFCQMLASLHPIKTTISTPKLTQRYRGNKNILSYVCTADWAARNHGMGIHDTIGNEHLPRCLRSRSYSERQQIKVYLLCRIQYCYPASDSASFSIQIQ